MGLSQAFKALDERPSKGFPDRGRDVRVDLMNLLPGIVVKITTEDLSTFLVTRLPSSKADKFTIKGVSLTIHSTSWEQMKRDPSMIVVDRIVAIGWRFNIMNESTAIVTRIELM